MNKFRKSTKKVLPVLLAVLLVLVPLALRFPTAAHAGLLSTASVVLGDSRPSQGSVTYSVTYTFPSTTSIECIDIILADTTGHIVLTANPSTTIPSGITTTASAKGTITGGGLTDANWSMNTSPVNGVIQYESATPRASTATSVTITTTGITNPSAASFYAQIATYTTLSTHTCSGLVDSSNVMALVTTSGVLTNVTIDPTLSFSVADYGSAVNGGTATNITTTSSTIPFGTVAAGSTGAGSQTLTVSTNAAHGYTVYIRDTQSLTDPATDTISDTAGTNAAPAAFTANTFGYTEDHTSQSQFTSNTWAKLDATNRTIATRATGINADAFHVEYKVQVSNTQPPGTYTSTVYYTAVPVY